MSEIDNPLVDLELVKFTSELAPEGFRWGWLGEDGEQAYAIGHDVDEDAFARVLELDSEDEWNFDHTYFLCTQHVEGCEGDGCYCDDSAWFASLASATAPGAVAVTLWSA